MQKINYQKELDAILLTVQKDESTPTLLLHSCCAPCSSYVLEYLSNYFLITILYYNPNISPKEEYEKRLLEQKRFITSMKFSHPVQIMDSQYDPERFFSMAKGMETIPEGGKRCHACYEMRLREAARMAKKGKFDYFTTTLTISPMKNSKVLNDIGAMLEQEYGVSYLYSDFKKKNGYKRSIELSREYGLYRQNYCGCVFSKREAKLREEAREEKTDSR